MGRKAKNLPSAENNLGQHLALPVAAHLARTQLAADALAVHAAPPATDMLEIVAAALARVAPLYVQDPGSGAPRPLVEGELEGAVVKRAGAIVALKDGRSFSSVSLKRADLRQAIAVLKAVGIPELEARRKPRVAPAAVAAATVDPLEVLCEIETLVRLPLVPQQVERAMRMLVSVARSAPQGRVANFAMQLMSMLHEWRASQDAPAGVALLLARLRSALHEIAAPRK